MVQERQRRDASETAVTQAVAATSDWAEGLRRWMFRLKSIDAAGPTKRAALDRLFGEKPIEPLDSQDSHGISRPRAPSDEWIRVRADRR